MLLPKHPEWLNKLTTKESAFSTRVSKSSSLERRICLLVEEPEV